MILKKAAFRGPEEGAFKTPHLTPTGPLEQKMDTMSQSPPWRPLEVTPSREGPVGVSRPQGLLRRPGPALKFAKWKELRPRRFEKAQDFKA